MRVEGQGDTSFAASAGSEPKGTINVNAVPEAPISQAPVAPAPARVSPPAPKLKPAPAAPAAPAATAAAASIQLGAFSSNASAEHAWKALSGRFKYLAPLSHSVTSVKVGGKTLYRLRAGGPNASGVCGRLRVAGETCVSIG
jgi:cell division septation protein DedD